MLFHKPITETVYASDNSLVKKNASIIIKRIPANGKGLLAAAPSRTLMADRDPIYIYIHICI